MNDKNVVFGRIIEGMELMKKLDIHGNANGGEVTAEVIISDCGQIGWSHQPTIEAAAPQEETTAKIENKESISKDKKSKACTIL